MSGCMLRMNVSNWIASSGFNCKINQVPSSSWRTPHAKRHEELPGSCWNLIRSIWHILMISERYILVAESWCLTQAASSRRERTLTRKKQKNRAHEWSGWTFIFRFIFWEDHPMNNQAWRLGDLESDNDITALIHPQLWLPAFSFVVFLVRKLLKQHHQDQNNWKSSRHHPSPRASFAKRVPWQWSWIGAQGPGHWSDDLQCSAERHGIVGEVLGTGGNQWQIRKYIEILRYQWNPTLNHQPSTRGCKADFYMKRWLLDESEAGGFI